MPKQQQQQQEISAEDVARKLEVALERVKAILTKELPGDVRRIKSATPTPESNQQAIHATVMSYVRELSQGQALMLEILGMVGMYMADSDEWFQDISDNMQSLEERVDGLDGDGDTVIGREDYEVMSRVASGAKIIIGDILQRTFDEKAKESLAELLLDCEKQLKILQDFVVSDEEEFDDEEPIDPDEEPS